MTRQRIACIGECMVELGRIDLVGGSAQVGFAGDTFNTAIYLSRVGCDVTYVTNLGTDAFSDRIVGIMQDEGIATSLIGRHDTRLPGIYAIETDAAGERSFRYWRESSAARTLFSGIGAALQDLAGFDVIYTSGITLAILPAGQRDALIAMAAQVKAAGKIVVFDTNHRPRLWPDAETARGAFSAMWANTTIALPSYDDEERLYAGQTPEIVLSRIAALGPKEIVLKNGAAGPLILHEGQRDQMQFEVAAKVVDTSGAGDSFNAGYLAARLGGAGAAQAAAAGHRLATTVIGHHGAVIPKEAMPAC
jgi:2-dehydro-3-deoxygluconokinase